MSLLGQAALLEFELLFIYFLGGRGVGGLAFGETFLFENSFVSTCKLDFSCFYLS